MFLSALFGIRFRPPSKNFIRHRPKKPSIKVGKDEFQLTLDLGNFNSDELVIKAHPEYVLIEGKQERETVEGLVYRKFVKKYKLPKRCIIEQMKSHLSPEGILTVTAPMAAWEPDICETVNIPIAIGEKQPEEKAPKYTSADIDDYCKNYPKVKPK